LPKKFLLDKNIFAIRPRKKSYNRIPFSGFHAILHIFLRYVASGVPV
jgi:hypothetical protein